MKSLSAIGLVGLSVMGEILILKMTSKGCNVTACNCSQDKVDAFLAGRTSG
ncbi:MAG: NAD(P)-binding domain-containing protein [Gammaproteobacteria bacterium]